MIEPFAGRVVVDLGTGDGRVLYEAARADPGRFHIGIDASRDALAKISERIHRKPAKGGLSNILYLQAALEELPVELEGVGAEVLVLFPWGTLLRAVAGGDELLLGHIRRLCAPGTELEVALALDPVRDAVELTRLGLSVLTPQYLSTNLAPRYRSAGFDLVEKSVGGPPVGVARRSSWGLRLLRNPDRSFVRLRAIALCA